MRILLSVYTRRKSLNNDANKTLDERGTTAICSCATVICIQVEDAPVSHDSHLPVANMRMRSHPDSAQRFPN